MSARIVDTAALAAGFKCSPAFVRRLARIGILVPVGKARTARLGRPSTTFDLDAAKAALTEALTSGRVELDQGRLRVRK